jgi:hypothetical protein
MGRLYSQNPKELSMRPVPPAGARLAGGHAAAPILPVSDSGSAGTSIRLGRFTKSIVNTPTAVYPVLRLTSLLRRELPGIFVDLFCKAATMIRQ